MDQNYPNNQTNCYSGNALLPFTNDSIDVSSDYDSNYVRQIPNKEQLEPDNVRKESNLHISVNWSISICGYILQAAFFSKLQVNLQDSIACFTDSKVISNTKPVGGLLEMYFRSIS